MIEQLDRAERDGGPLALERAWPRSADHLHLEYRDPAGRIVAAQWHRDRAELERIARGTRRACPQHPGSIEGPLYFHSAGGDRKLALRALLDVPGAALLSHRPERRAVVRLDDGARTRYAKVHRPGAEASSVGAAAAIRARRPPFELARVLEHDPGRGLVVWSAIPGQGLFALMDDPRLVAGAAAAGAMLAFLHGAGPDAEMPVHDAAAEAQLLETCLAHLTVFAPVAAAAVRPRLPAVLAALRAEPDAARAVHRDFYDRQVLADFSGPALRAGLLDLDTLAAGEPALDVANFLAHLDLRVLQGRTSPALAGSAAQAFLDGYGRGPAAQRIEAYRGAARMRLACLYAYRPRWRHLVSALAAPAGRDDRSPFPAAG